MSTQPEADELRIRNFLMQQQGIGPYARPPAIPPKPATRPRDWLDDILDTPTEPAAKAAMPKQPAVRAWWEGKPAPKPQTRPAAGPARESQPEPETRGEEHDESDDLPKQPSKPAKPQAKPSGKRKAKPERRGPNTPRSAWDTHPVSPRQSLVDAWARVPYRLKWLIQHALAAAIGWRLGWVQWGTDTAAWYAAGHWTSSSAWVLYGLGACALALYSHTRTWRWLVACATAVPVSSVAVGVLLYGTGYQP